MTHTMLPNVIYFLTFFLACVHFARGQIPFPGTCPEVKVLETFDLDKYMGTWYEYSKYPFVFEMGQKCQQAVYKNLGDGNVSVVNTGVYILVDQPHSTTGTAKVLAPGKLAVAFGKQKVETPNYLVLDTDYDNYAVVFSCRNITSYGHTKLLWILTRQRQPSDEALQQSKEVIKLNKLSEAFLMTSTQTNCPKILQTNAVDDQTTSASSTTAEHIDASTIDFSSTSTERVIDNA